MPMLLDAPQSPTPPSRDDPTDVEVRHAELDDAARRWLHDGPSPENVAAYAHALRALIGDL